MGEAMMRLMTMMAVGVALAGGMARGDLAEDARTEMRRAVRPGGVDGHAFWNGHSRFFMYPPAFDFKPVDGAADYLYRVTDDFGGVYTFRDPQPTASLLPVWEKLKTTNGFVTVTCLGADKAGRVVGEAGFRSFFRKSPYVPGSYPAAACSYADCARRIRAYVSTLDIVRNFSGTVRDAERYCLYSYPSKLLSSLVKALLRDAEAVPERRETSRAVALRMGEFLLAESFPATAAWPNVPPTYWGPADDSTNAVMTCYPADAGRAYLALARATGDGKWLAAARAVGETYLGKQGADGSWCMKVDARTGKELVKNRIVPLGISDFLAELGRATGDARFGAAAARAFENVLRTRLATWNWEGQFEDTRASAPYENLTKHEACSTAIELLRRHPKDPAALADARELLRFAEDQFVFWTRPRRPDGASPIDGGLFSKDWRVQEWVVPSVTEQYFCYWPIDASVAKLIRTYLALYRAEGRPLDLAKARTLGDSVTRIQDRRGRVPTFWVKFTECPGNLRGAGGWYPGGGFVDWLNCMVATAEALDELVAAE